MSRTSYEPFPPRSGPNSSSALTGLLLVVYMVLHLVGNLLIFFGPGRSSTSTRTRLISNPLIMPIELALLAMFLLHIYKAVRMWLRNRAARPGAVSEEGAAPAARAARAWPRPR